MMIGFRLPLELSDWQWYFSYRLGTSISQHLDTGDIVQLLLL